MELLKEKDMKLLSRKRLTLLIDNTGSTPSRLDLIKKIAEKYKTKEDLIVIKHIYQQFGKQKSKLIVHIYKDKKKMDLFEHENLLKKHKEQPKAEEKPAGPAPTQENEPAEEKPPKEKPTDTAQDKQV